VATALLGSTTTTGDAEGEVLQRRAVRVGQDDVDRVRAQFLGAIAQTPPMHSALKKDGKPLYEYARAGIEVAREPREVTIHALSLALTQVGNETVVSMQVHCSKGTYIRTLAQDIGEALGCGAHLTMLRRVDTGGFGIAQCIGLTELEALDEDARLARLRPVADLLQGFETVVLGQDDAGRFLSGVRRRGAWPDNPKVAVYGEVPRALLGSAHVCAGELIPDRLLSPLEIEQTLATR